MGLVVATGLALTALLAFAIYGALAQVRHTATSVAAASAPRAAGAAPAGSTASGAGGRSAARPAATAHRGLLAPARPRRARGCGELAGATAGRATASPPRRRAAASRPRRPPSAPAALSAGAPAGHRADPRRGRAEGAVGTTLGRDEKTAWRELAALWKVDPGTGDPCTGGGTPAGALLQVRRPRCRC